MKIKLYFFIFLFSLSFGQYISLSTLYKSINPKDISKHLAFYNLYADTNEGKKALQKAWELLTQNSLNKDIPKTFPKISILSIINLLNRKPDFDYTTISEKDLELIETICKKLKNRTLKTYGSFEKKDFLNAPAEEIDIARGLFLMQLGSDKEARKKIRFYEAIIDLMAMQILLNLPKSCTDIDKIQAINNFIFFDQGFKFPAIANSKTKESFTSLPSVIDRKKGVCLGLSILYKCIAQRIDLQLNAITPPGHIYLNYNKTLKSNQKEEKALGQERNINEINIETTARGIHIPSERYLSLEIKKLPKRSNKELIGLVFINEAAVFLNTQEFEKAEKLYEKALLFLPDDFNLKQLLGCMYLFNNKKEKALYLFKKIQNTIPPCYISTHNFGNEYLNNKVSVEALKIIFEKEENERVKIIEKKKALEKIVDKNPNFFMGVMLLANYWLKLERTKEALILLKNHYKYFKDNPIYNFYLSSLFHERYDFPKAWKYFLKSKNIYITKKYLPKTLEDYEKTLKNSYLY